jgi:molecular chaperone DnaK
MGHPEVKAIDFAGIFPMTRRRSRDVGHLSGGPDLAMGSGHPEDSMVGNDAHSPPAPPAVPPGAPAIDIGLPDRPVPPARLSRISIGIDLGTSNSCAAVVQDGRPRVIPSRDGYNTIPSMVALNQRNRVVVGRNAKGQLLFNPAQTVHGAKRLVGRAFDSAAVQSMLPHFPYDVVPGEDGLCAVRLGPLTLSMEQVQALVLREVKGVAETFLGEEVNRAVITVPAYYSERQREAVRRAGALAGLHVERVLNEPTAASLAYAWGRNVRERVLVYDLGGGTFDASVLELADRVYQVVSTGGDTFLGGVDFDERIVAHLVEGFERVHGPFQGDAVARSRLADAAERAKCALSEQETVPVHLPFLTVVSGTPTALDATLTRADLEGLVAPLVERTVQTCARVLADKGLDSRDVDEVILVGGQSRMPLVQERIRSFFGKAPSKAVHPDEAVAIGAALLAQSLNSAEGVVLIDVVPISIGVGLPGGGGRVKRVIERNSPLPVRKEYQLATTKDDQKTFDLWIFEGEGATVAECQYLGTIQLTGLPRGAKGSVRIAVAFELGEECLLAVRAREIGSGREVEVVFTTKGTPDEVRKRVQKEASYAAAGIERPPAAGAGPPTAAGPGGSPSTTGSREIPRPASPAAPSGGLKGLWGKITGR